MPHVKIWHMTLNFGVIDVSTNFKRVVTVSRYCDILNITHSHSQCIVTRDSFQVPRNFYNKYAQAGECILSFLALVKYKSMSLSGSGIELAYTTTLLEINNVNKRLVYRYCVCMLHSWKTNSSPWLLAACSSEMMVTCPDVHYLSSKIVTMKKEAFGQKETASPRTYNITCHFLCC